MPREPFNPARIKVPADERRRGGDMPLTVSQVTRLVKHALETALPPTVRSR